MEALIEKYEKFMEIMKRNQEEIQNALIELGFVNLNHEEREYSNDLMDEIKHTNYSISNCERAIKKLQRKIESANLNVDNVIEEMRQRML